MVIMERSRSPIRPPSSQNDPSPLVGFPVWTRPMGSGTQVPPPRQYPSNFTWSQQGQGSTALPESMMIPPGPGVSQLALDLSQPSAIPVPSWQPQRAPMATPRHTVQGCGMAGMVHNFSLPLHHGDIKVTYGQDLLINYDQNTPTPPRTSSQSTPDPTFSRTPSTVSGRTPNIQFGQNWKADEEFYDNQKVNGLPLPRVIRSSSRSQFKDKIIIPRQ